MAKSQHSAGFQRLFDKVAATVAPALEWRVWENTVDAQNRMSSDITCVAISLYWKRGALSRAQSAFLCDLMVHADGRDNDEITIEDFIRLYKRNSVDKDFHEPPIVALRQLRGYDAAFGTHHAHVYKDFLSKIMSATLTTVESATPKDKLIMDEFETFWTEVLTASRNRQTCLHSESIALIEEINQAVRRFVVPVRDVADAQSIDWIRNIDSFIRESFRQYFTVAIQVDSKIEMKELELFCDLAPTFEIYGNEGSFKNLRENFGQYAADCAKYPPIDQPFLVDILDDFDNAMNTEHGSCARALFFRIVNTVFKSDGEVCPVETAWLTQFKATLYPEEQSEFTNSQDDETGDGNNSAHRASKTGSGQLVGNMTVEQSLEELHMLIGLDRAKQDLSQLVNFIKVQQMRVEKGLPASSVTKHIVFYGNPGTGKTTVARILANIYRALGILSKGQLVEVDRPGLVAGYVGQTALKVKQVIASALGGVLFIDEAYSLVQEGGQDSFGLEAIDTLVKAMEDHRDNLVVIVAGYPEKMARFVNANPGLKSRFNKFFLFDDYSPNQMFEIFELFCKKATFKLSPLAPGVVKSLLTTLHSQRGENFGNARDVRNVFEAIISNQANRIVMLPQVNETILSEISQEDVLPLLAALSAAESQTNFQIAEQG